MKYFLSYRRPDVNAGCCGSSDEYILLELEGSTKHAAAKAGIVALSERFGETWGWDGIGFVPDRTVSEYWLKSALLLRSA